MKAGAVVIEVSALSDADLVQIIAQAAAELQQRAGAARRALRVEHPAPAPQPAAGTVLAPNDAAERFIVAMLKRLKAGELVRAAEKDRYAQIAQAHAAWIEVMEIPRSLRHGAADAWVEYGRLPK